MSQAATVKSPPLGRTPRDEAITAALLDALCSPQLYEVVMQGGDLLIRPRPHMHPQKAV
jgi:hypothetical protein